MKRWMLLFFFVCLCTNIFGQLGYRVGSMFKELYPDNSSLYYVQTKDADQMNILLKDTLNKTTDNVKVVANLSEKACIVNSKMFGEGHYISEIYNNQEGHKLIILPRIAIKMKDGYEIENILNKYSQSITFDKKKVNLYLVDCVANNSESVLTINNEISIQEGVEWCEPMIIGEARKANELESLQYYLKNIDQYGNPAGVDINVEPAWDLVTVDTTLVVAVIDDGVERNHEDLVGSVIDGYTLYYPNEKGDPINEYENYHYTITENGITTDWYDTDTKSHGTACAGIIAAKNNTIGIRGVASGVKILPINIHPQAFPIAAIPYPTIYYEYIGDAITWAYTTGNADIINFSLNVLDSNGNTYISNALNNAMNYGRNGKGTIVVCAAGNINPYFGVRFPANMANTIAVGAVNKNGDIWNYSCRGSSLDLVAPSSALSYLGDIVTTDRSAPKGINPTGDYMGWFGGTSVACSQVAGVVALMLSANPNLTASQVRSKLRNTARKLPGMNGQNRTDDYGYGLVDAFAAVIDAMNLKIVGLPLIDTYRQYDIVNLPSGVTVSWNLSDSYYNNGYNLLIPNYPTTGHCLIIRDHNHDMMNATLTANVKYNGVTIKTLTKAKLYAYEGFKGHYVSGNISSDIDYTYILHVTPNYNTIITSPNFLGATVSYDNTATIPLYWGWSPYTEEMNVTMPSNNNGIPIVINIDDVCGNHYTLYLFPTSYNSINIISDEGFITVTLNEDGDSEKGFSQDHSWTVEVRSATTGVLKATQSSSSRSETISTYGWPKGIYIVKVTVGKDVQTEKVVVK